MFTNILSSSKSLLQDSLSDLYEQMMLTCKDCDFLLFAIHPDFHIEDINNLITNIFKTDKFVAFHAINAFKNNEIVEKAVTLCYFKFQNNGKIDTFYLDKISLYKQNSTLTDMSKYLNENTDKFHIILTGVCHDMIGYFINDVSKKLTYQPIDNIIGGVSSGVQKNDEEFTFLFVDNKILRDGLVVLSFSNIQTFMDISLGFKPYGITYEIKKAHGTKLYSVDDNKDFSYIMNNIIGDTEDKTVKYLWYVPLCILDTKDGYVSSLSTIKHLHDDCVELFAPVEVGQHFKLSFATPRDLIKNDKKIAKRLIAKIKKPEISFNFSCIARQYVLENLQRKEIQTYTTIFNTNLFGFFTFGEIGPDKMFKKLKFYNETSLVVIMSEK